MDELIKLLDENLRYLSHRIDNGIMYINVESSSITFDCPYCNTPSNKVHSRYERQFQDLPIQGYKVMIVLTNKKFLCKNPDCSHTTFAETFSFIKNKAKMTNRLENEIVSIATSVSSITASKILKNQIADIGKSTICNLLKKRNNF